MQKSNCAFSYKICSLQHKELEMHAVFKAKILQKLADTKGYSSKYKLLADLCLPNINFANTTSPDFHGCCICTLIAYSSYSSAVPWVEDDLLSLISMGSVGNKTYCWRKSVVCAAPMGKLNYCWFGSRPYMQGLGPKCWQFLPTPDRYPWSFSKKKKSILVHVTMKRF